MCYILISSSDKWIRFSCIAVFSTLFLLFYSWFLLSWTCSLPLKCLYTLNWVIALMWLVEHLWIVWHGRWCWNRTSRMISWKNNVVYRQTLTKCFRLSRLLALKHACHVIIASAHYSFIHCIHILDDWWWWVGGWFTASWTGWGNDSTHDNDCYNEYETVLINFPYNTKLMPPSLLLAKTVLSYSYM